MTDTASLREKLLQAAPTLCYQLSVKAERWTSPVVDTLNNKIPGHGFPKTFNDPVWGVITLYPWETIILDSPLLQRLRGVRQLGMAHHVYPGASHDRLEHSRGVVEASQRMMDALERNAMFRRRFGTDRDEQIPQLSEFDKVATRLAALLHDVGHTSFSHATENIVHDSLAAEFDRAIEIFREQFEGVTKVSPSELIAAIIILSEPMQRIFEHPRFEATDRPATLPLAISARILGSRSFLLAGYLSGIISGPIDADKLDYMARDCHHAGLPLGLDIERLINKLEVVTITPDNANNPELRARAERSGNKRIYEIGISLSGLGAYEQMIIGRVILYDRLYYHHKVRSAEAMVRQLVKLYEEERNKTFTLQELFNDVPDDTTLGILGGLIQTPDKKIDGRCAKLAEAIQIRNIYYRAFAFAPRFIAGLSKLSDEHRKDAVALLWVPVLSQLSTTEGCKIISGKIFEVAQLLKKEIDGLKVEDELYPEHILVDLPLNRVVVRGGDILTRTEDGQVGTPNLFFDPERWSQAYEHQKQCGFVFTPKKFVNLIAVASRIVFFETYGIVMDVNADRASKTSGKIKSHWFLEAAKFGICTTDCAETFKEEIPLLIQIRSSDLDDILPKTWRSGFPELTAELSEMFQEAMPAGFAPRVHKLISEIIGHMALLLDTIEKGGDFVNISSLPERLFQNEVRNLLRAQGCNVQEGTELGGGETDLIIDELLVIENKVLGETDNPFDVGEKFDWQARRYSISVLNKVAIVCAAYRPEKESSILPLNKRFSIRQVGSAENEFAVIRVVVPWGYSVPSKAKPPK
ncbi:hypothetical protein DSCO28_72450 (plasmid) [Desulfosarcina ovata subsp. sediminis]|uniref:HD domain-containing protein n=1 Tax=Desulfosarcina ovata subsp. sediminis TaxID=885957 RepID=A0A5K8A2A5_9BACT|nr:HD domain-containing protein [Desulfosarcina ovata]BBO86679.1 hypothetical protein DSCO28_72450 [Desulfosarcina ovata subsp. sediminis]